ncbi:MAG TPA: prolipoprotein diacylglyceryl transferase [Planctomycetaceae bacterium]|nr:prolipoprotein diacylglyceryl transferase [Planctomycetaceae bacterium]
MRQILFRLRLDDLFTTEPIDGTSALGVGWLLVPWLVYFIGWLFVNRGRLAASGTTAAAVAMQFVFPLLVLAVWQVSGRLPTRPVSIPLYGYGLMLCLATIAACWTGARRVRRLGVAPEVAWDMGLWLFACGLFGARLFYILQYPGRVFFHGDGSSKTFPEVLAAPFSLWDGGLVVVGCIPFGVLGYFLFCHRRGLRPLVVGDAVIPSFFIGLGIGRIGCLLNGCCWGDRCDLPWAISFPKGGGVTFRALMDGGFLPADALWTFPLHPTQIYSSINAFILAAVTAAYFHTRPRPGSVVALGAVLYAVSRFTIEFLRGDEMGQFGTSLTISQWYCVALFAVGLAFTGWLSWSGQPVARPRGPVAKPERVAV